MPGQAIHQVHAVAAAAAAAAAQQVLQLGPPPNGAQSQQQQPGYFYQYMPANYAQNLGDLTSPNGGSWSTQPGGSSNPPGTVQFDPVALGYMMAMSATANYSSPPPADGGGGDGGGGGGGPGAESINPYGQYAPFGFGYGAADYAAAGVTPNGHVPPPGAIWTGHNPAIFTQSNPHLVDPSSSSLLAIPQVSFLFFSFYYLLILLIII